jgi:energy-coupling factor transporter transmembrane protein EcfT
MPVLTVIYRGMWMAEIDDLREELERLKAADTSDKPDKIQMTSGDIVRLVIAAPVVFCWLFLGSRIIISATTSQAVLEHIEPLLLALSILTIPVTGILASLFKVDGNGK